jgi:shikimate kinase
VVLVGMMGSGKTTVGRRVAEALGRPFFDSDAAIEARTGRTVAQIFADEGEPAFRDLEVQVLFEMLGSREPAVIAAAGGTVIDPENRLIMKREATVVWLRADPEVLAERVRSGDHRPLLEDDALATLTTLARQRRSLYEEVADAVVDVDMAGPARVTEQIVELVGASP